MASESSPVLARQPSGIRAVPSNDDDDDFDANLVYDNGNDYDNSVDEGTNIDETNKTLSVSNDNSINGSSSNNSTESSSSFGSGINGGLVNGSGKGGDDDEVEIEDVVDDPDEETSENKVGGAKNEVSGGGSVGGSAGVPVAKVSGEGDDDDNEVVSGEEDGAQVEESYGVKKDVPKVRVSVEEEEDEEEEWGEAEEGPKGETPKGDEGEEFDEAVEGPKAETPKGDEGEGEKPGEVEEGAKAESPKDDEGEGGESSEAVSGDGKVEEYEGSVVDSIKLDVGEAVRSKVAVVGVDEKQENEPEPAGETSVDEQSVEGDLATAEDDTVVSANEEGNSVKNPSYADVVGMEKEQKDESEPAGETSVVEQSVEGDLAAVEGDTVVSADEEANSLKNPSYADVVSHGAAAEDKKLMKESEVGGGIEDNPPADETASADSATDGDVGVKYTDMGDAIVDSVNVDAAEAVRSGTAVVGVSKETKDSGAEEETSFVENAAQVVDDSAPEDSKLTGTDEVKSAGEEDSKLTGTDEVKPVGEEDSVVDGIDVNVVEARRSGIAVVGDSEVHETEPEAKDAPAAVAENVTLANEFVPLAATSSSEIDVDGEQQKESQSNEAEAPQLAESVEQQDAEETKLETDLQSKEQEHTDEQQFDSGEVNEKALPPADVPDTISAIPSLATLVDAEDEELGPQEEGDAEGSGTDEDGKLVYFGSGGSSNKTTEELESQDRSEMIDDQVIIDSEDEGESDEEGEGKELFDSAALAALLKAATNSGSDPGTITITSQDGSRLFSVERPAGLGPSLRSVRPASGPSNSNFLSQSSAAAPSEEDLSEEEKSKLQKLQQLKVKFLRLVQRVGFTAEHSLAAQVLYKLSFFGGRAAFPAFSLDNAKQTAMQLEAEGKDDLKFSLTVLVIGKTGVGKSAIINSVLGEEKVKINAFEPETTSVTEICGTVDGVKIRFIDAPGLKSSAMDQGYNRKVLASVKKFTKKNPVDVMFYVDRLDSQTRDLNDLPMLRTITSSLGSSIWRNTIITLTHASSAPPDGPTGTALSYEVFVAQRSHIVQQSIGQAVGDMRLMNLNMMNPVSLVENHPACRKNREGQKVLPNGQAWRPQLLVLCYSVKILSEASSNAKPQDPFDSRKLFGFRVRSPPLPYLLSSLLQPRAHPKLSADQGGDSIDSDVDLDDLSDSDQEEEEDEYDQLPPFKPLRKAQMAKLSSGQKKAYYEEYDYRVKLLQKKQWKEELKRMREMKKGKSGTNAYGEVPQDYDGENGDGDNGAPAAVPVPLPDMVLPPSFDSDNPAYRYRFLEPTSQFLARPVLDTHGWDHDCGYDGVNVEQNLGIARRFPAAVTVQVTKDKKDFNVHLDSAVSAKHGDNGSSLVGFDVQSIGKQYAYIIRGESKFKNLKKNKTAAGVSVTFLGENVATGVKLEDQITLNKRLVLVGSTGTVRSQKDAAYGANLEVRLREADFPIGQEQSSFTLSLMKWRGDLAVGGNLQSQISVGRNSKMALRVALNNKQSGQITLKTSSSDHISLAFAGLLPIAISIYRKLRPGVNESYSVY